jgi:hypothetical protein
MSPALSQTTRPRTEPVENEFLLDLDQPAATATAAPSPKADPAAESVRRLAASLLATIEHGMREAKALGLEAELAGLVRRTLPDIAPPAPKPQTKTKTERVIADAERAVCLVNGITVLQRYERRQPAGDTGDVGRKVAATCIEILLAALRGKTEERDAT